MLRICAFGSIFLVVITCARPSHEHLMQYRLQCMEEVGLGREEAPKLRNKAFYVESEKARCMASCMAIKIGVMTADGQPNMPKLLEMIRIFKTDERMVKACIEKNAKETNVCNKVFETHKCVMGDVFFRRPII